MEVDGYVVTDAFFGAPYVDLDEERDEPLPHRRVHGGFAGTDTRFTFYLPSVTKSAAKAPVSRKDCLI